MTCPDCDGNGEHEYDHECTDRCIGYLAPVCNVICEFYQCETCDGTGEVVEHEAA